ncbi:MAG: LysM peptidoglycan-binding domain-containing protein [Muribaculaceae bacterium]|nr:LysM peptidoglycan-binding domain-containing protein [Muribaculaceae bacterium]
MKTITQKLIAVLLAIIMGISMTVAQTRTVKHNVERGETLASIAKRYGTTNEKIIELNPDASQFIYVGMELTIPVTEAATPKQGQLTENNNSDYLSIPVNNNSAQTTSYSSEDPDKKPGFGFGMEISLGFPPHDSGSFNTYDISCFMPYWIKEQNKGLFASAGIGYSSAFGSDHFGSGRELYSGSSSISLITIPLKVGFAIGGNDKFAIVPYAGFNLGITVKGENKIKHGGSETKYKIKAGKFAPDFRLGADLRLWIFNVGGYFAIPISDDSKAVFGDSGYFAVAIGFGL